MNQNTLKPDYKKIAEEYGTPSYVFDISLLQERLIRRDEIRRHRKDHGSQKGQQLFPGYSFQFVFKSLHWLSPPLPDLTCSRISYTLISSIFCESQ